MIVGAALLAGALVPQRRWAFFTTGILLAAVVTLLTAPGLVRPIGSPTAVQVSVLAVAVAAEAVLIGTLAPRLRPGGARSFDLAVPFLVGLRFLPMSFALGPWAGLLGLVCMANAGSGLWVVRDVALRLFWGIDSVLKMGAGALMYFLIRSWPG